MDIDIEIEKRIGYTFKNKKFLQEAFTHTSYANEKNIDPLHSNERLEFLGDAVLELVVSNFLFLTFPELSEGQLSKFRAVIVCEESFAKVSRRLDIGQFLRLGKGERQSGGTNRTSTLADLFEAVIGGVYLDSDYMTVKALIIRILEEDIMGYRNNFEARDFKTYLQEILQATSQAPILYSVVKDEGPPHNKLFTVNVIHENKVIGIGLGKTKKEAEQNSAKDFLIKGKYI